jgi:2-oxoacid:acceptor oxidoreductase delta subunit (pyruvate/2-ketoisovalerate family)
MNQIAELHSLKERAQAIKARLHLLDKRIGEIQGRPGTRDLRGVVDLDRCVGCGICEDVCPEGAIVVNRTARVDPWRCKGCGICVDRCPQGALSLRPRRMQREERH